MPRLAGSSRRVRGLSCPQTPPQFSHSHISSPSFSPMNIMSFEPHSGHFLLGILRPLRLPPYYLSAVRAFCFLSFVLDHGGLADGAGDYLPSHLNFSLLDGEVALFDVAYYLVLRPLRHPNPNPRVGDHVLRVGVVRGDAGQLAPLDNL